MPGSQRIKVIAAVMKLKCETSGLKAFLPLREAEEGLRRREGVGVLLCCWSWFHLGAGIIFVFVSIFDLVLS